MSWHWTILQGRNMLLEVPRVHWEQQLGCSSSPISLSRRVDKHVPSFHFYGKWQLPPPLHPVLLSLDGHSIRDCFHEHLISIKLCFQGCILSVNGHSMRAEPYHGIGGFSILGLHSFCLYGWQLTNIFTYPWACTLWSWPCQIFTQLLQATGNSVCYSVNNQMCCF